MASREEIYAAIRNADKAGDTASVQKLAAYLQTLDQPQAQPQAEAPEPGIIDKAVTFAKRDIAAIPERVGNFAAGVARGAGSIGATILAPVDAAARAAGIQNDYIGRDDRREAMTGGLQELGADPNSAQFKVGKLVAEVAGTAGAGGAIANGARVLGAAPELVTAISSGGLAGGGNALTRLVGGAASGGASAGLVDPHEAGKGLVAGGVLPGAVKVAGAAGNALSDLVRSGARHLMQSAIKPTIAQRASGEADTAINALLEYGISPTKSGVNKLRTLVDDLNTQISDRISNSTATVDKRNVLDALDDVRAKFTTQVSPTKDMNAIQGVADDFAAHPDLPGVQIPVQKAQELKQGTYRVLSKKYGEAGSAETEAQKGLARGLKDEIALAVPGVDKLNAEESRLLTTLSVAERRALLEANKNPMGLAALAHNPLSWAAFMADRSSAFKALAARMANASAPAASAVVPMLGNALANPLLRSAGLVATEGAQ